MTSVNTKIADAAIGHQVDLLRVEAGLRRDVLTLMQALSGDLAATLAKAGEWDAESIPLKLKRLQGLKGQTDGLIGDLYAKLETDTLTEMKDAATFAAQWAPQAINAAVGVDIAAITLTPQLLNNLVKNTLVEGAPSAQWWSRQSDSLKMDFSREMRMGILQGENLGDLTRRIRGRKENGYADGLLPPAADAGRGGSRTARAATTKATRAAEGLALTSVQQVMSDARMEAYQQNADIIKGVQQLSTLDGRTSATCRGLDHAARALDGSPLPGLPLLPSGGPPWHWRCRSVLIPLTKSWAELGIKGQKEIPPGTRASMDGQVPETMDYGTWLKSKPEAFQKEVLGKGRFELWRDGKADLKDMVDQRGRPVKVRELNSTADGAMVAGMKPRIKSVSTDYGSWAKEVLASAGPRDRFVTLGTMRQKEIDVLESFGVKPVGVDIVLGDRLVNGPKAKRHMDAGNALTSEEWDSLSSMMLESKVARDTTDNKLLYILPSLTDERVIKVVVESGVFNSKLKKDVNQVNTVFKINGQALEDETRYERIR